MLRLPACRPSSSCTSRHRAARQCRTCCQWLKKRTRSRYAGRPKRAIGSFISAPLKPRQYPSRSRGRHRSDRYTGTSVRPCNSARRWQGSFAAWCCVCMTYVQADVSPSSSLLVNRTAE
ncbi:hypothetical protein DAEQUDRAFT_216782 [Daedalea quercina L-15889]|uniref:Uncharacterized protein n=1 Tax=Daedalea quercina L-15889 TaxID=1314783 RepID=A0A165R4I6_9APHY|nr:hypothetical protein DAEQUDRAFT_216782 [Daedalea quercina L-15889]